MAPLETLGFALAGYGCTTCIGNSGPLDVAVAGAVEANDLVVAAVLSGNRNFEGRIHPLARASYLASPPLVVAFALAGRVDTDLTTEPLGFDDGGEPVFLADIWPSPDEIRSVIGSAIDPELFRRTYATVFDGDDRWRALPIPSGDRYAWAADSTYIAKPPFFDGLSFESDAVPDIVGARALAVLGDSVTTDHISPAGSISPVVAGRDLAAGPRRRPARLQLVRGPARPARGHDPRHVREHPAAQRPGRRPRGPVHRPPARRRAGLHLRRRDALRRRGHAARPPGRPRIRLRLVARLGREGHDAPRASRPSSPSRTSGSIGPTWSGMGVLPLQFQPGENAASLGLTGRETFAILGLADGLAPRQAVTVVATRDAAAERRWRRDPVHGDRPPRRTDRRRLLPGGRHPAGRPAPAGGGTH